MQEFLGRVSEIKSYGERYCHFYVELVKPHRIKFESGQFVMIEVNSEGMKRAYSIASSPAKNHGIELLIGFGSEGEGEKYFKTLKPGDELRFWGPVGEFKLQEDEEELVMVATGIGIAPIRSMILCEMERIAEGNSGVKRVTLFWGLRHKEDIFGTEDWDELAEERGEFSWELVLSQPGDDWPLARGHVNELVADYLAKNGMEKKRFYLCGVREMIEGVKNDLVDLGVSDAKISFEKF